jgi:hypothetical protein
MPVKLSGDVKICQDQDLYASSERYRMLNESSEVHYSYLNEKQEVFTEIRQRQTITRWFDEG